MIKRITLFFLAFIIVSCGGATLPLWFADFGNGYTERGYVFLASNKQHMYHVSLSGNDGIVRINTLNLSGEIQQQSNIQGASYPRIYELPEIFYQTDENGVFVNNPYPKNFFYINAETNSVWVGLDESYVDT